MHSFVLNTQMLKLYPTSHLGYLIKLKPIMNNLFLHVHFVYILFNHSICKELGSARHYIHKFLFFPPTHSVCLKHVCRSFKVMYGNEKKKPKRGSLHFLCIASVSH